MLAQRSSTPNWIFFALRLHTKKHWPTYNAQSNAAVDYKPESFYSNQQETNMKISEAPPPALDWLVAKAEGVEWFDPEDPSSFLGMREEDGKFRYSEDWSQGGPIIERERISVIDTGIFFPNSNAQWKASIRKHGLPALSFHFGPTPLIAAMRCFVVSRLGEEVDVPEELL